MNKQLFNNVRLMTMHASAMKAYSDVLERENYLPNTIKNYPYHFEAFSNNHVHRNLRTTMIYTHVSKEHLSKIQSPLDKM